jgi:mutual gliding-motility protein MglA
MHINWQLRELNLKIVYYGPALSGKTTNLEQIHARVDPKRRSELVCLKTHEDRTLFFDFMQLELGKIGLLTPKIHLYTVPGQAYYEASRKLVLRSADGVVFVADSGADKMRINLESWLTMNSHLGCKNLASPILPIVVQFNKQDLPNAMSPERLRNLLDLNGHPTISAVANQGTGVFDTLKLITINVISKAQNEFS